MRILNFGSLNIDHVYRVPHLVQPGQTISSSSYQQFAGGKGFNQSIALAQAGAEVHHAGQIGPEGAWLLAKLRQAGVHTEYVEQGETPTGHALIQVEESGENAIILFGGANQAIRPADVDRVVGQFGPGDVLLLQNEISSLPHVIRRGSERGMSIVLNPAPMDEAVGAYPLEQVSLFILNEGEGRMLTGEREAGAILTAMQQRFPQAATVLTLGTAGAMTCEEGERVHVPAVAVQAVDTTAAGDTFIGYFLAERAAGLAAAAAMQRAVRAAALCVTRPGAADSIPTGDEVDAFRPDRGLP